ncbi:MAG: gala protein 1 [Myxococcaceae bacterium]|nr:gala protein 1 [Myxococcaceae bacterium]
MPVAQAALLEAISAAPELDAPRLVYADWLEEQHDPRGELIHLQIAQARLRPRSAEFTRLQRRIDTLWAAGQHRWAPKVASLDPGHFCEWSFTRGFATAVHTVPAAFVDAMDAFFAAAPLLEEVQLDCGRLGPLALEPMGWLERMFAVPAFGRVRTLRLQSLNDAGAVVLCGLARVNALRQLELARTNLGVATYQVLGSRHSSLRSLGRLELRMANARDVSLEHLFALPWPRLQGLRVANEVVGERGMRAITEGGKLPALTQLDLSWSVTGGTRSMQALAACRTLPALAELDLSHCEVSDAMCEALAQAEGFTLQVLRLAHSGVGPRGVRSLLDSKLGSRLELLDLTGCPLDGPTRALLADRLGERALLTTA